MYYGWAQVAIALSDTIYIQTEDKTIKQIIGEVEKVKGIKFFYSDDLLPKHHFNRLDTRLPLNQFLRNIFSPYGISYKIVNDQIVLYKENKSLEYFFVSGFMIDKENLESIINGTIYCSNVGNGAITNNYGYFTIRVPQGETHFKFHCLGYKMLDTVIDVTTNKNVFIKLQPTTYQMTEVVVADDGRMDFMESSMHNFSKQTIAKLKTLPNIIGEHDALRNLDLLPGLQTSEFSTSNICARGGASDQTTFLMDGAKIYSASHFGGFASIFNPDVINDIKIYKEEMPVSETGTLSAVVDVSLRDGDMKKWRTTGSIGLLSAKLAVEGPIKKDTSSLLVAFRRTYSNKVFVPSLFEYRNMVFNFYYYDVNVKYNYKFNSRNRLYWSWYIGCDKLNISMYLKQMNNIATLRYNHIFGDNLFCNLSFTGSSNHTNLSNFYYNGAYKWRSICWNGKIKLDFSHYVNPRIDLKYGSMLSMYSLEPFDLELEDAKATFIDTRINAQPIKLHGSYVDVTYNLGSLLTFNAGGRLNYFRAPSDYQSKQDTMIYYPEWNVTVNCKAGENLLFKLNTSSKYQPIHQLQVSSYGITVNRWMPANDRWKPGHSLNTSVNAYYRPTSFLNATVSLYYRKLENLIESMQETRLIYEIDPEKFLHHSKSEIYGGEFIVAAQINNLSMTMTYDYTNSNWLTLGLNADKMYPASFIRKHSFVFTSSYKITDFIKVSTSWQVASGVPYTAAVGKYVVDGKMVLQFDEEKINTKQLPQYRRFDLSIDIESRKNQQRRWQSAWNIAIYNLFARKNPLGIAYFTTTNNKTVFNPSYYYFYQFVPSVTYRFSF